MRVPSPLRARLEGSLYSVSPKSGTCLAFSFLKFPFFQKDSPVTLLVCPYLSLPCPALATTFLSPTGSALVQPLNQ